MEKTEGCIKEREEYVICEKNGKKITVRKLQLEVLTIMDEIHRVCEKNNIRYALIAGSALGIVNYKGFIPWDDDIDICVLREDWDKFIDALNKDLGDDFYFQCYENDKKFNVIMGPTMKIRKKNTYIEEVNVLLKNRCKSGDGIFIDALIYDNINENKYIDEANRLVVRILMPLIVFLDNIHINPIPLKNFVRWHAKRYAKKNKNSSRIGNIITEPWVPFLKGRHFDKKDVLPFRLYDFEGRNYYSYNNIEKISKENYGPNCLKKWDGKKWVETLPIEKRKPKHTVDLNLNGSEPIEK